MFPFTQSLSSLPSVNPVPIDPPTPVDFRAALGRALRVRWEGDQSLLFSLARANQEFCLGLMAAGDVELSLVENHTPWHTLTDQHDPRFRTLFARRDVLLSGPPDVTIRHQLPPNWKRPETGKLVILQPWEYCYLPREWAGGCRQADEIWVNSRFERDAYVRSGIPAEKLRIIPLGINPQVFRPDGPHYPLLTRKSFRFLFVGGAVHRKGTDLLLGAYRRAFTPEDDVCLVIKDMGTRTIYRGNPLSETARQMATDPRIPEILYLDQDLSDEELAALYRACHWGVFPYRAEGFCLPPLEGMACGLPSIVTSGGPTDDYLDETMAIRLAHRRISDGSLYLGPFECVGEPWQLEADREALVETLRWVRDHPEERETRTRAAYVHAQANWSWDRAVGELRARLLDLVAPPWERPIRPARPWSEPNGPATKNTNAHPRRTRSSTKEDERKGQPALAGSSLCPFTPFVDHSKIELSLCMIVRDEEPRLAHCLHSISPYVDEMVVVDTGSTDRTREVARDCGARVFEFDWVDTFAEARNQSVAQAHGDWILRMDADDLISPEDGAKLRELIQRYPNRDVAFLMEYRTPSGPGGCIEHVADQIKLFPNRPEVRFEYRDHEQLLPSILRAGLSVVHSHLAITHQNYDWSSEGLAKRRRRHFRLIEIDLKEQGEHPFVLYNLGTAFMEETGEYEVAAHYLRRCLQAADPKDDLVRSAHVAITASLMGQGDWTAALAANEEGRRRNPEDAELLLQAGHIHQQLGRWDDGRWALERLILGYDEPEYRCGEAGLRTYRGRHELALLLWRRGQIRHCEQILREVMATYPAYLPAQLHLVEALHALGETEAARQLLARIPDVEGFERERQYLRELVG